MNKRADSRSCKPGIKALAACVALALSGHALAEAQRVGSWEYSIDVPWRLQPGDDGVFRDSIPVSITINDANHGHYTDNCDYTDIDLSDCENPPPNTIKKVTIVEKKPDGTVIGQRVYASPDEFASIEKTLGYWQEGYGLADTLSAHGSDRPGAQTLCGYATLEPCVATIPNVLTGDLDGLGWTSEWHAVLAYKPVQNTPGARLILDVTVEYVQVYHSDWGTSGKGGNHRALRTKLMTRIGQKPLPKFGDNYAYGDLHYHSQGTDNTGETGYSYRESVHAMNAIGLDWVVFSDHANNTTQVSFLDVEIDWDAVTSLLATDLGALADAEDYYVQSDMSPERWSNHWSLINGDHGNTVTGFAGINMSGEVGHQNLNQRRGSSGSSGIRVPAMILGGEVDYIPETGYSTNHATKKAGLVPPFTYRVYDLCHEFPTEKYVHHVLDDASAELDLRWELAEWGTPGGEWRCENGVCGVYVEKICTADQVLTNTSDGRALISDVQGRLGLEYARQHLIHIPADPSRSDAGVMGNTNRTGGASRRLKDIVQEEYVVGGKGFGFLAHPNAMTSGEGQGRLGPDMFPLSIEQLQDAMQTPYILGLQAWNENEHVKISLNSPSDTAYYDCGAGIKGTLKGAQDSYAEDFSFDLSLASYDPDMTVCQAVTNGPLYDPFASLLDDNPHVWDEKVLSRWAQTVAGFEMLDIVNLMGMRGWFAHNLAWLGAHEPRKMFLAGGSDAHGDFNHRRDGYYAGTSSINDTAMGTPRNLVMTGMPAGRTVASTESGELYQGQAYSHSQIVGGLASGNFSVTDGPAVRIAIDMNGNGVIDDADTPMGGTYMHPYLQLQSQTLDVLVEFKSTQDFGKVTGVYLFMGGVGGGTSEAETRYGPQNGPRYEQALIGNTTRWGGTSYVMPAANDVYDRPDATSSYVKSFNWRAHPDTPNQKVWSSLKSTNTLEKSYAGLAATYAATAKFTIKMSDFPVMVTQPRYDYDEATGKTYLVAGTKAAMTRAFFRAEVATSGPCSTAMDPHCVTRVGATNPVWAVQKNWKN